jgi:lipopolysaccharide export system protein LptA
LKGKSNLWSFLGTSGNNSVSSTLSSEGTVKTQAPELRINSPRMNVDEKQINFFDKVSVEIQSKEADFTHMTMSQLLLNFEDKKTEETETTKILDNIVATGKVHIIQTTSGPERKTQQMKSETMKVQLDEKTGAVVNVCGRTRCNNGTRDVVASGKKAVFDTATQLLELTGYPVAKMPRGTLYADKMIWDRKANVFKGVSNFRIDGQKPNICKSSIQTSSFSILRI